ncbi:hypothetical protein CTI12_AA118560 [Artemisia annua]|uniref:Uncharacterized protein n=1 Tax=Artemisia annua TaxID=35608 RepID=A0A2U1PS72_ARTAN|nr:hypothetical protein CTI12_AA118560 [Artemisia annua]
MNQTGGLFQEYCATKQFEEEQYLCRVTDVKLESLFPLQLLRSVYLEQSERQDIYKNNRVKKHILEGLQDREPKAENITKILAENTKEEDLKIEKPKQAIQYVAPLKRGYSSWISDQVVPLQTLFMKTILDQTTIRSKKKSF